MRNAAWAKAIATIVTSVTNDPRADPRKLKPGRLVQVLNSTPLGEVIDERRLRKFRAAAGTRIGDGKTIDLVRFIAWLAFQRDRSKPTNGRVENLSIALPDKYSRHRDAERQRNAEASRRGRDIGPLPPVKDPERRAKAGKSLLFYLQTYYPKTFVWPWSDNHKQLINELQRIILHGGRKAKAMPRGEGKTAIMLRAGMWGIKYGYRKYQGLIGANGEASLALLEATKYELETNDRLAEDFPEVCVPIRELDGIHNRAKGQHIAGVRTKIHWSGDMIVLPTVVGSKCSGAVIQSRGILGRVRGMFRMIDGGVERPDCVLLDDIQTDESAASPRQCTKRLGVVNGAILGLAGPGKQIAAMAAVTVIEPGDAADQLLDREKYPDWDGDRTRTLYGEPKHQDLIDKYFELRGEDLRTGSADSLPFYKENQTKIEDGYRAAWAHRILAGEVSAIHHALNLMHKFGPDKFAAEYNNEPRSQNVGDDWHISADELRKQLSGLPRLIVPKWATRLTAFIDLQQRLLYYGVAAFEDENPRAATGTMIPRGTIIDYGTWPRQQSVSFTYRNARYTLAKNYPKMGVSGAIRAGLHDLTEHLLDKRFKREDNAEQRVSLLGIDSGNWTDIVHEFTRTNKRAQLILPMKGKGVLADDRPISEWKKSAGQQIGREWMLTPSSKQSSRLLLFDTNYWKRELFVRFSTPLGDAGSMTFFGQDPHEHEMISEHFRAETVGVPKDGNGRKVHPFNSRPNAPDNHLFDCAVGALVLTLQGLRARARQRAPIEATYF